MKQYLLAVGLAVLMTSCSHQDPNAVLYQIQRPVLNSPEHSDKTYSNQLEIGIEGHKVPIKITWGAQLDNQNCLRINSITVARTGGDPHAIIDQFKVSSLPVCELPYQAKMRDQITNVDMHYSVGLLPHYDMSASFLIMGNGAFSNVMQPKVK